MTTDQIVSTSMPIFILVLMLLIVVGVACLFVDSDRYLSELRRRIDREQ